MKIISAHSLRHALKERRFWGFCAAMSTDEPMPFGPNQRRLK